MQVICSAVAVIRFGGEVLLLLRHPEDRSFAGSWCLPGGKADAGETRAEAMIREVKEETNFTVGSYAYIGDYVTVKDGRRYEIRAFLVRPKGPDHFRLCKKEFASHTYATPEAALEMDLAGPTTRSVLEWCRDIDLDRFTDTCLWKRVEIL